MGEPTFGGQQRAYESGYKMGYQDGQASPKNEIIKQEDKLEVIAKAVHNAWWKEKIKQGKAEDHPDAISYSKLPENIKEYDRVTARTVLNALEQYNNTFSCDEKIKALKAEIKNLRKDEKHRNKRVKDFQDKGE